MSSAALPPWITSAQREALGTLVDSLREIGLPFQATGGLAGNLHGSQWPLHDLDFDVAAAALPVLAAVQRSFDGPVIPTTPLALLIAYKRTIGRRADVADLRLLPEPLARADRRVG